MIERIAAIVGCVLIGLMPAIIIAHAVDDATENACHGSPVCASHQ